MTTRMARSAHGLDNRDDGPDWRTRSLCAGKDPNWWTVGDGALSVDNGRALALCARCPVRIECRDDMLTIEPSPKSIIAGGWRWDSHGGVTAFPGDPVPDGVRAGRPGRGGRSVAPLETRVAAARRYLAGERLADVVTDTGLSHHAVYDLARVLRYGDEGLVEAVTGGLVAVRSAMRMLGRGAA